MQCPFNRNCSEMYLTKEWENRFGEDWVGATVPLPPPTAPFFNAGRRRSHAARSRNRAGQVLYRRRHIRCVRRRRVNAGLSVSCYPPGTMGATSPFAPGRLPGRDDRQPLDRLFREQRRARAYRHQRLPSRAGQPLPRMALTRCPNNSGSERSRRLYGFTSNPSPFGARAALNDGDVKCYLRVPLNCRSPEPSSNQTMRAQCSDDRFRASLLCERCISAQSGGRATAPYLRAGACQNLREMSSARLPANTASMPTA